MNGTTKKKLFKTLAKLTVVLLVIVGSVIAVMLYVMARRDKEHAKFFNTGKSVNVFLGNYTRALRESFEKKDPAPVMGARRGRSVAAASSGSDGGWSGSRARREGLVDLGPLKTLGLASVALAQADLDACRAGSLEDDPDAEKDHGDGEFHGVGYAHRVPVPRLGG